MGYPKESKIESEGHGNHVEVKKSLKVGNRGLYTCSSEEFQMPLHYPRYTKEDYENMEEWRLDLLLNQYGLINFKGAILEEKRAYAIGSFLWPDQYKGKTFV